MVDLHAPGRESGVDRAVAVASEVERLIDLLVVMLAVPAEHECDVDLREPARPLRLLLAPEADSMSNLTFVPLQRAVTLGMSPKSSW